MVDPDDLNSILTTFIGYIVIIILSLAGFVVSFWLGLSVLLFGLLLFTAFWFRDSENVLYGWAAYLFVLITAFAATIVQSWLAQSNVANIQELDYLASFVISILVSMAIAFLLVGIPIAVLNYSRFSLTIEGDDVIGSEKDKARLESFGGPGFLRVLPGRAVALQRHGVTTRIVSGDKVRLKSGEKIKAIVPLSRKSGVNEIENLLTRDRIALKIKVAHGARIETAQETRDRLVELELDPEKNKHTIAHLREIITSDMRIGTEPRDTYVGIAKLVSSVAADPWAATKGSIESILRDIFISNDFDDYFETDLGADNLQTKIDERMIDKIEKHVKMKVNESKRNDGIVLDFVDISEIYFPEQFINKLKKISEARLDEQAAMYEARAKVIRARADAQKKILEGQSEGEARAAFFRELLRELKREEVLQGEAMVDAVIELIGRMVSAQDLRSFIETSESLPAPVRSHFALTESEPVNGVQHN